MMAAALGALALLCAAGLLRQRRREAERRKYGRRPVGRAWFIG